MTKNRRAQKLLGARLDYPGQQIRPEIRWRFERHNGRFGHGDISFLFENDGAFEHRHDMPPTSVDHQLSSIGLIDR